MDFIDCMLIPVDKNRLDAYKDFAEKVDAAFIETGALERPLPDNPQLPEHRSQ